jgi:hypothetical protein
MLFADLRAFELEQVFGAAERIFEGAIGVVEQRVSARLHWRSFLAGAGKAVGMHLAAEAMELMLQGGRSRLKAALEAEDLKIIAAGRRLNLAAMRAEEGGVGVPDGAGPTGDGTAESDFEHS